MGAFYMRSKTGQTLSIDADGNAVRGEQEHAFCDKCETWQDFRPGLYVQYQGLSLIWLCQACK